MPWGHTSWRYLVGAGDTDYRGQERDCPGAGDLVRSR